MLADVAANILDGRVRAVLRRHDDGVNSLRLVAVVLDGHLRLAIRPQVLHVLRFLANLREPPGKLVREEYRQRHEHGGLGARIAEHHPLVSCAVLADDSHTDVRRLLVDRRDHRARLIIEPEVGVGVPDVLDHLPRDARNIHVGVRRDLTGDESHPGGDQRFARHFPVRVLGQDRVEHAVRNLVRDLVGVPFRNRLGCEKSSRSHSLLLREIETEPSTAYSNTTSLESPMLRC